MRCDDIMVTSGGGRSNNYSGTPQTFPSAETCRPIRRSLTQVIQNSLSKGNHVTSSVIYLPFRPTDGEKFQFKHLVGMSKSSRWRYVFFAGQPGLQVFISSFALCSHRCVIPEQNLSALQTLRAPSCCFMQS